MDMGVQTKGAYRQNWLEKGKNRRYWLTGSDALWRHGRHFRWVGEFQDVEKVFFMYQSQILGFIGREGLQNIFLLFIIVVKAGISLKFR